LSIEEEEIGICRTGAGTAAVRPFEYVSIGGDGGIGGGEGDLICCL